MVLCFDGFGVVRANGKYHLVGNLFPLLYTFWVFFSLQPSPTPKPFLVGKMADLVFLQRKKEWFERRLNSCEKDSPFVQYYRDGVRFYEEELALEYKKKQMWLK